MRYQKTELSNKKHIPDKKYKIDERYIPPRQVKILTAQRKRRKRRLIRRFLMIGCGLVLAGTLAVGLLKIRHPSILEFAFSNQAGDSDALSYSSITGEDFNQGSQSPGDLKQPVKMELNEIYEHLQEMSSGDDVIRKIYDEKEKYPEPLLLMLVNNPEMEDFVAGYLSSDGSVTGGFTNEEINADDPLLLQWDKRWGYAPYGDSNIAVNGCGPVCLSMVNVSLTGDSEATPDALAKDSDQGGFFYKGAGTSWEFMVHGANKYGVSASELPLDESSMKNVLDSGGKLICSMRAGDFTSSGHFIVIYGYDENGFKVNDPNSIARSRVSWSYERLSTQISNLWSYCL